jgi:hypothetical protein
VRTDKPTWDCIPPGPLIDIDFYLYYCPISIILLFSDAHVRTHTHAYAHAHTILRITRSFEYLYLLYVRNPDSECRVETPGGHTQQVRERGSPRSEAMRRQHVRYSTVVLR